MMDELNILRRLGTLSALFGLVVFASLEPVAGTPEAPASPGRTVDFASEIRPLLESRCVKCHGPEKRKSGLRLDSRLGALIGGDSGPAFVAGKSVDSRLIQLVSDPDPDHRMPQQGDPLSKEQIEFLRAWIDQGAVWPEPEGERSSGGTHRAFLPIRRPPLPNLINRQSQIASPIDLFIRAGLEKAGLSPSPEADRATLLRRLSFDLTGLPPTLAQLDAFLRDKSPRAYEKVVDQLLALPQYGERWGRHWLDVARYTESQGFEYDHMRENAWHYRDYVIKAFNQDKPYDQFMREQIAGDVFEPVTTDGIVATSLLICGAWDQAGNGQANVAQRMTTREEEMEDLLSVVGQTFLGLTLNCARCHSHKFDPIPHYEYYQVKAVFDGVRHGERVIATPSEVKAHEEGVAKLKETIGSIEKEIAMIEARARAKVLADRKRLQQADASPLNGKVTASEPNLKNDDKGRSGSPSLSARRTGGVVPGEVGSRNSAEKAGAAIIQNAHLPLPNPISHWSFDRDARDEISGLTGQLRGGARIERGRLILDGKDAFLETEPVKKDVREKTLTAWVSLTTPDQGGGGVISIEGMSGSPFDAIVFGERQRGKWSAGSEGFVRTKDLNVSEEQAGLAELTHVAITYQADGSITLYRKGKPYGSTYKPAGAIQTFKAGAARILLGKRHTGGAKSFLTGEIEEASLFDRALTTEEIAAICVNASHHVSAVEILGALSNEERNRYQKLLEEVATRREELRTFPTLPVSYAGIRKQPEPTHRLKRGDVRSPAELVNPGALSAIEQVPASFGLAPDAPEADRRRKFADWLSDRRNPLPARVMVNRVWQHHFGVGLVATANDFGASGSKPTHPELLDWLAAEFIERGWSLKALHRLIVSSAAYRQASTMNPGAAGKDAENQLLWRFTPQRLSAEAVRDAMLAVSGELNFVSGGPSFRPFDTKSFNATFYIPADKPGPEFNRRTVYRMNINSGKDPMLETFDCPDPSVKTPRRGSTTTPLQALSLMNNSFVHRQAERLADRVRAEAGNNTRSAIQRAYRHCLARLPSPEELKEAEKLAAATRLENLCWALLNSTEFVYVR
ncbi:MAG: DUF1553 domain-containing protein [Pedosphaera sp.]|nr:DUF1553 domain-containing protein [Pedosphaera sp.]